MDAKKKTQIAILGAGISGLATAYWLTKAGFYLTVLEKNDVPGGSMESTRIDGYLFDRGPNSGLETTPLIQTLVEELNLKEEMVYANPIGDTRYILRGGVLHPLPMRAIPLLRSKLFSLAAKFRLLKEPLIGRSADGYYQSLAEFVERRLGSEFLDYVINPFVSGVYAGRPEDLSVHSAFPKLYELEEKYGGLIKGTIRSVRERKKRAEKSKQSAKMFSFKHGMQTLPKSIAAKLGSRVSFLNDVVGIQKVDEGFEIQYNHAGTGVKTLLAKSVISTIPAYTASKLFQGIAPEAARHFDAIYHPPVMVILAGFKKNQIKRNLDGFGFLIPEKENMNFLGAIWSSVLFPARSPMDSEAFTIFVGGARNPEIIKQDHETLVKKAVNEFQEVMRILGEPDFIAHRFWSKAIPQYNIGYIEHERYFDELEKQIPGLFVSGNFRGGISVGDCIKNSELVAKKAMSFIADSGD
jgi:oxygen-dependent protoporphyrinogen oxidase